jgi:hypothetical protein
MATTPLRIAPDLHLYRAQDETQSGEPCPEHAGSGHGIHPGQMMG